MDLGGLGSRPNLYFSVYTWDMTTHTDIKKAGTRKSRFPAYGWLGLVLALVFWLLNWTLPGTRTHMGFFPMWLGYCLTVDGLVCWSRSTSLITRSWRKYIGLF